MIVERFLERQRRLDPARLRGRFVEIDERCDQEGVITADGLKKVGFNFENVSYINSAGMAIIISILTKSRARGQALRSWGLTDHFQKLFEMVGITKYMKHKQNEEEALKGF